MSDWNEIVGGAQCRKHPRRCDLSRGIVADDVAHTVTFHLTRPDPDFLYKLALPAAYVLAERHAAAAGRNAPAARDRPLHDRGLRAEETAQVRPQSVTSTSGIGPHSRPGTPTGSISASAAPQTRRFATSSTARPISCGWASRDPVTGCRGSSSGTRASCTPTRARTSRRSSSTPASRRSTGSMPVRRSTSPSTAPQRRTPGAGRRPPSRRARSCHRTSPATAPTARTPPARRSAARGRHPTWRRRRRSWHARGRAA